MTKENKSKLINEEYLRSIIDEMIDEKDLNLKKEEANEIVRNILPHLDVMVSKKVKEHFIELAEFIKKTFKGE